MNKLILGFILAIFLFAGCKTIPEKDRLLSSGTFEQKLTYLEDHASGKSEVAAFLGAPDKKKDFSGFCSVWSYGSTQDKLDITFGADGRLLYVENKGQE